MNSHPQKTGHNPVVFFVSATVIGVFVVLGALFPAGMGQVSNAVQNFIVTHLGWVYIAAVGLFLIFVVWLMISRYGDVRLGDDDEQPTYSVTTWFSMLFSAGMGIGLLFFSVAEPVMHYTNPPRGGECCTIDAARDAMTVTFFHWGLHAWAIYAVVGLTLAYFAYRRNLPLTIRSSLYPLLGGRIHGPLGDVVDIFAVFGTLFGIATSLGLGVMQINAGLASLGIMDVSQFNQLLLIAVVTLAATISVVTGLDKGIRRLSEFNLGLGIALLVFVLITGPTVFLLSSLVQSIGNYAQNLLQLTFRTDAFIGTDWQGDWTLFYWAWWISWSPFVGMFIARVSRGRTVREFIAGVLLAPTLFGFIWLVVFGNTALHMDLFGVGGIVAAVEESVPSALYVMLGNLPWAALTSVVATTLVAVYFVTSSDSGSMVIDILTSGGNPNPPVWSRIFWSLVEGTVAAVLLISGGLLALQTAAITTALPFTAIVLVMCWGLVVALRREGQATREGEGKGAGHSGLPAEPPVAALDPASHEAGLRRDWRHWMRELLSRRSVRTPGLSAEAAREELRVFLQDTVVPAFESIREELVRHGREGRIEHSDEHTSITVLNDGVEEFSYAIRGHIYHKMAYAFPEFGGEETGPRFTRAEVVMRSGRRERRLPQLTRERIIEDFLTAYQQWMGW